MVPEGHIIALILATVSLVYLGVSCRRSYSFRWSRLLGIILVGSFVVFITSSILYCIVRGRCHIDEIILIWFIPSLVVGMVAGIGCLPIAMKAGSGTLGPWLRRYLLLNKKDSC